MQVGAKFVDEYCMRRYECKNGPTPEIVEYIGGCDPSMHESCKLENGVYACVCDKGFTKDKDGYCVKGMEWVQLKINYNVRWHNYARLLLERNQTLLARLLKVSEGQILICDCNIIRVS